MKTLKNFQKNIQKNATNLIIPSVIVVLFSALGFTLSLAINDLFNEIKKKYVKDDSTKANVIYVFVVFSINIISVVVLNFFHIKVKNPLLK